MVFMVNTIYYNGRVTVVYLYAPGQVNRELACRLEGEQVLLDAFLRRGETPTRRHSDRSQVPRGEMVPSHGWTAHQPNPPCYQKRNGEGLFQAAADGRQSGA